MNSFCLDWFSKMSREQLAVQQAKKVFLTGRSKPLDYRIQQLKNLSRFITEKEKDITDALRKDLYKVNLFHNLYIHSII